MTNVTAKNERDSLEDTGTPLQPDTPDNWESCTLPQDFALNVLAKSFMMDHKMLSIVLQLTTDPMLNKNSTQVISKES